MLKENLEAELLADGSATRGRTSMSSPRSATTPCRRSSRDGETFSSAGYADVMGAVMGHTILEMDEPEHHTYRGLVQQAFSRKAMERWEADAVGPIVDECIDAFVDRGEAELVRELTFPFPVNVIAGMLGLPTRGPPAVPPLGGRAHQRRRSTSTAARDAPRSCATTSPACSPSAAPTPRTTS